MRRASDLASRLAKNRASDEKARVPLEKVRLAIQETPEPGPGDYEKLLKRVRQFARNHLPSKATVLVASKGDERLLKLNGHTAWHFPRTITGAYPGYYPACDLAAIAHLDALRGQGAEYLLLPRTSLWWLEHYKGFYQHLEACYSLLARDEEVGAIYLLKKRVGQGNVTAQLADFISEFQTRFGREPVILDLHSGVSLSQMFPKLSIFQPVSAASRLPYLDHTVDVVVTAADDGFAAAEARRIASAAVAFVGRGNGAKRTLAVEWSAGFSENLLQRTSIIIPCHDGRTLTNACLESLSRNRPYNFDGEIIVVDDASSDGTAELLKAWARRDPCIKIIRNEKNLGFVDSCNIGARHATGEILVFLNNDVVLLPGWLKPMLHIFRNFPQAGAVGGKLIFPDGTLQEAGGVVFNDGSAMNFGRGDAEPGAPLYSFVREVDYCSAALLATRRELFEQLSGFGTDYRPGYYEDTDYCFKIRKAGFCVYFQPEAAIVHREGGTAGNDLSSGMKRHQAINKKAFCNRWASALKEQREPPHKLDERTKRSLVWRRRGKQALVSAACPPEFDRDSGSRRLMDLIEMLIADGWTVSFLAAERMGAMRYLRALQQLGVPVFDGAKTRSEEFFATMQFDLALVSLWTVAEVYIPQLRRASPETHIVVDSVDLSFLRNARRLFREQAGKEALDERFSTELLRELNAYAAADAVLTVSQKETNLLNDFIGKANLAQVVPDVERSELSRAPLEERRGILFVGSFRHRPNVDAVTFLCKEIVPLLDPALLARHPFYIVGESLDDSVRELADGLENVHMVGWVPSVAPYLQRARISVVPLRYGAGTKRKLLQTVLSGTPAVSTTIGVEGFDLRDGQHVLIADKAERFARAIERLMQDDKHWQRLAERGREKLLAKHGADIAAQALREAVERVLTTEPKIASAQPAEKSKLGRLDMQAYSEIRQRIRSVVETALPRSAKVVVVSRGDDELLKLNGRAAWHFPQNADGVYAGHHPASGAEVVARLEELRARGAEYLLLPSTQFWWLDHYKEFRRALEMKCTLLAREEGVCAIYKLWAAVAEASATHQGAYFSMLETARSKQEQDFVPLTLTSFASLDTTLKLIAFYLPQFHPISENDEWWGKGFTEWTNVSKAVPQFTGHYQPHLPGELGFYDLRVPDVQRRQVELAKKYGLHGFCFYYYWFAGKRLLERPLNQFMADPEIDFPFCICWANENWTRRWDGRESDVLIAQQHSEENDIAFIRDAIPVLQHKNYIRVNGRPLLMVYRMRLLPNAAETAQRWRKYCEDAGVGNPYLVVAQTFERIDPREIGFDAAVEFPPNTPGNRQELNAEVELLNPNYSGKVYRYDDLIKFTVGHPQPKYDLFRTVCPSWDNEARSPGRGMIYALSSPEKYGRWLKDACRLTLGNRDPQKHLVFINAWNEWAEGTHLEPDRRYGYAYLQTTANVVASLSKDAAAPADWTILFVSHDAHRGGAQLVLLNQIEWFKQHTSLRLKVLCLDGGEWLGRFEGLAETAVLADVEKRTAAGGDKKIVNDLLQFCGSTPDLIYANSAASGKIFPTLRKLGKPILTHVHELASSIERYAGRCVDDVVKHSAHFIACSDAVRESLSKRQRIPKKKISTVFASIRPHAEIHPLTESQRRALRKELDLPKNQFLVFGCGLGMPFRKGADLFIQMARQLRATTSADFHCCWIGDFDRSERDAHGRTWAEHLANLQKSGADYLSFLGVKENPRRYLQSADVFVLPSREDPFPLVALEAAECGLPIVCFDKAGGMPGFVGSDAGIVASLADTQDMARAVKRLIEDQAQRQKLGCRAREKVLSRFSFDFTAPQILSVSRSVAGRTPAVSVIVPNYNHARYLPERLDSIFNQTFRDFEVILLDDASSDASVDVFEKYRGRADVRIVLNERNSGSTFKQWLKGIEMARADIIWIAESDDRAEKDFIQTLLPAFQNPRVKLAYSNSNVIDERGAVIGDYTDCDYLASLSPTKWTRNYIASAEQEINDGLGVKNTILSASAAMFRKFNPAAEVRRALEAMRIAGDWYFVVHAIAGGEVCYTSRKLNYHRRHDESVVGKLLKQNRVTDFFREFYAVQSAIFERYPLLNGFPAKWEKYLKDQWAAFFPDRPFSELNKYYPFDQARRRMAASCVEGVEKKE